MDVDACFGLLLCWEVKFLYNVSLLLEALRICANTDSDLEMFIYPSTLPKTCFSWKNPIIARGCQHYHHCPSLGDMLCHFCAKHTLWNYDLPKISTFVSSDYNIFFHTLLSDLMYVSAKLSQAWLYFFVVKGFCLANLPPSPNMKNMGDYLDAYYSATTCQKFLHCSSHQRWKIVLTWFLFFFSFFA